MPERAISGQEHHLTVAGDDAGLRLDVFISRLLPALSRTQVRRLIDTGHVTIAGRREKASLPVEAGMTVAVVLPPPTPATPRPEAPPLPILYEDADIVVVDKPAGMVVHPAAGHADGTMVNALLHHVSTLSGVGGETRPGIVHRLDRGTSGVMVVAKHDRAHRALAKQFHDRAVDKEYVALVWGAVATGEVMRSPIGRDPHQRLKMSSRASRGRAAETTVVDTEPLGAVTLVHVRIGTGRTHQIRVHLSEAGHPIVGDRLYGGAQHRPGVPAASQIGRPFLHAERLAFRQPITGEPLSFEAPLPQDLRAILTALRQSRSRTSADKGIP